MAKISRLPKEIYDRIAAGEVITSPAAVVKELVENALDSGAASITVEIQEGGKERIRVSDNGCGMGREDIAMCVEKHATSKIDNFDDLYALSSLGFRGEALASIAEVSRLTISSRERDAETGYELCSEGNSPDIREAGLPEGTTVKVEDIFFNIPARRKHMRAAAKEAAAVTDTVKHLILSRPGVAFKYIRNGRVVYQTPGDGDLMKACAVIYGSDSLRYTTTVNYEGPTAKVTGVVSKPTYIFKTASRIELFVNGRYVQSKELQRAAINGYRGSVLNGHYPQAILHIELDPSSLDINIHPSKISVLLFSEEDVSRDVSQAVSKAVLNEVEPPILKIHASKAEEPATVNADSVRQPGFWQTVPRGTRLQDAAEAADRKSAHEQSSLPESEHETEEPETTAREEVSKKEDNYSAEPFDEEIKDMSPQDQEEEPRVEDIRSLTTYSIVGTAFATYIFCEAGDTLYAVDQHAARERLTYERLLEQIQNGETCSQLLLLPVVRTFSEGDRELLARHADLLSSLGVIFEPFGELALRFLSFPVPMDDVDAFLDSLLEELRNYGEEAIIAREKVITAACRHSVKAGTQLTEKEIEHLMHEITSMSAIPHCPHGRPIAVAIPRRELEKGFKRTE